MKIEILSGSYVMDEEVKPYITVADETAIAAISQKIAIRQRREAEKEERKRQKEEERKSKELEREEQKRQKEEEHKRIERERYDRLLLGYQGGYDDYE